MRCLCGDYACSWCGDPSLDISERIADWLTSISSITEDDDPGGEIVFAIVRGIEQHGPQKLIDAMGNAMREHERQQRGTPT